MIATLRACAQARPIVLAGFSLGGFVAWAIALRLAGTATPVAMLFVLDADMATPLPLLSHGSPAARLGRFLRSLGSALRNRNLGPVEKVVGDYIGCRLALATGAIRAAARVRFLPLPSGLRFRIRFSLCSQLQLPLVRTWLVEEDAYSLRLDHTPVVLICAASERGQNDAAATLGWEVRCTDLKVEWVDGDHNSMLCHRGKNSLYAQLIQALTLLQKFGLPTRINERE
jgi:thioesterase domain-containing protein